MSRIVPIKLQLGKRYVNRRGDIITLWDSMYVVTGESGDLFQCNENTYHSDGRHNESGESPADLIRPYYEEGLRYLTNDGTIVTLDKNPSGNKLYPLASKAPARTYTIDGYYFAGIEDADRNLADHYDAAIERVYFAPEPARILICDEAPPVGPLVAAIQDCATVMAANDVDFGLGLAPVPDYALRVGQYAIVRHMSSEFDCVRGQTGLIKAYNTADGNYAMFFADATSPAWLHTCDGHCEDGHGYWVPADGVEFVQDAAVNPVIPEAVEGKLNPNDRDAVWALFASDPHARPMTELITARLLLNAT